MAAPVHAPASAARTRSRWATLGSMWLLLALLACDRSYDGPPPSGQGAAVFGRVVGVLGSGINGVSVCARGIDVQCATSDDGGEFLLDHLPEDRDIVVTMRKDGHLPTAYHHHTSLDQEWRKTLMSDAIVNQMTNRADTEQVPGLGHAMFILWSGPDYDSFERVEGVSFTVSPGGGEHFYQAGGGFPDPDLTATSSSGGGGAFNLEPGDYALSFSGSGLVCEPWFSHAFEPGDPVPVTVFADMASYVDLVCR